MKRDKVSQILQAHRTELEQKYGVRSLSLFGSVARDEDGPASDVDLLVQFNRPVGYFGLFALQDYLESLLGRKVDLGTPESLKPRIRDHVMGECVRVA
jgi:predicted nucleotidyltransferase